MRFLFKIILGGVILAYGVLLFYILNKNLILSGSLKISYNFKDYSPYFSSLYPKGRVDQTPKQTTAGWYQQLLKDPVYLDLNLPRPFNQVQTKIKFQNNSEPLFELGLMAGNKIFLQPLENKLLEKLKKEEKWMWQQEGQTAFLQRTAKYADLTDFLNNLPPLSEIAVYNYNFSGPVNIDDYQGWTQSKSFFVNLSGNHDFYVYLKNEPLYFKFIWENKKADTSSLPTITVSSSDNQNIYFQTIGNQTSDELTPTEVKINDLPVGVYHFRLQLPSGLVLKELSTSNRYFVFKDHLFFAATQEELTQETVFTQAERLNFSAQDDSLLQAVSFGQEATPLILPSFIYGINNFFVSGQPFLKELDFRKANLKISGHGYFSLTKESFFLPTPIFLSGNENTPLESLGINYIIANYSPLIITADGWQERQLNFDLSSFNLGNNRYQFVFSFPYAQENTDVKLSAFELNFSGQAWNSQYVWGKIQKFFYEK